MLDVTVPYALAPVTALIIKMTATTDAETLCNLDRHSCGKLSSQPIVADYILCCPGEHRIATDAELIATGRMPAAANARHDWHRPVVRLRRAETYRQITRIRLTPTKAEPEGPKGHERGGESPRGG